MKTTKKKLLLVAAVLGLTGVGAFAVGCGGDDVSVTPPKADSGTDSSSAVDSGGTKDSGTLPDSSTGDAGDAGTDGPVVLPTGQIDRMGRPGINTALNFGDDTNKDSFNQEATYQDWTVNHKYDANFKKFLAAYDTLGGIGPDGGPDQVDWPLPDSGVPTLQEPLLADYLVFDTSVDCTAANNFCVGGYLEIEFALLGVAARPAPPARTCGGRTLAEDVMSKTLTVLITGGRAPISDNVAAATKLPTATFPYLAAPN